MPQQSLRFSVCDENGNRAVTWKLLTQTGSGKHDVYLTCRPLGGKFKASLHQSGSWHVGFVRDFLNKNLDHSHPKREDPYIDRWPRPTEIAPGVTLAYRIVVPTSGVNIPITNKLPKSIIWIPAAPNGKAVEIDVVFTRPDTIVSNWPGRNSMQTELVGKLVLENQEIVWVVHHVVDVPAFNLPASGNPTWFKSGRDVNLADGNIRAILFGNADDGSRFMVDCAVEITAKVI
jgi:hypothetical protein